MQITSPLVTTNWLAQNINHENIVILDGSVQCFSEQSYIPKARRFDFKNVFCDITSNLPGMMPSADVFNAEARNLGINKHSVIIVYDNKGIFSSPRVWWMFQTMGHHSIHVLDGGLPKWIKEKRPISDTLGLVNQTGNFIGEIKKDHIRSGDDIFNLHLNDEIQIIDARSAGRFNGSEAEPREGLRLGHIPNSINIPFTSLLKDGEYLKSKELKSIFQDAKLDINKSHIFSCGSGVTACVVLLAAQIAGYHCMHVYDGSWTEWGADSKYPISFS